MASPRQTGSTDPRSSAEQLRADIDSGRTGDKVAYPDPAGAPLGADDEAAGEIQQGSEAVRPASPGQRAAARAGTPAGNPGIRSRTWLYIAVTAAVLVILLLLGMMMSDQPR